MTATFARILDLLIAKNASKHLKRADNAMTVISYVYLEYIKYDTNRYITCILKSKEVALLY